MKTELKLQWLAALLSGEFEQGQFKLRSDADEYCCLGVLCEVTQLGEWVPGKANGGRYNYQVDLPLHGTGIAGGFLPIALRWHVGLDPAQESMLSGLNDHSGKSFYEIAKYVAESIPSDDELDLEVLV